MSNRMFNWLVYPLLALFLTVFGGALYRAIQERPAPEQEPIVLEGFSDAEIRAQINDDICVVALTIFAEARGESAEGRLAVASVIWNRAHGHRDMLAEVCLMNKQFSCWNGKAGENLLNLDESKLGKKEAAIFQECLKIAQGMMGGKFVPQVTATHYHSKDVKPKWARQMTKVAVIGRHIFYRA